MDNIRYTLMDISVVISAYNTSKFIRRCIDSVLSQVFNGTYEVIVVNDGSTDDTLQVLKSYGDRIRVIDKPHTGIADSVNLGLSLSTGKYIARFDSDDQMFLDRLQFQFDWMEAHPEYDLLFTSYLEVTERGSYNVKKPYDGEVTMEAMLKCCQVGQPTGIWRKELNLTYDPAYDFCEDYELWFRCLYEGKRIYNVNHPTIYYYRHPYEVTRRLHQLNIQLTHQLRKKYGHLVHSETTN